MLRHFKQVRFGELLYKSSAKRGFFNQVHVIFGGTGAVGGAMVLHTIDFFEEALSYRSHKPRTMPHILTTGLTRREIRAFTKLLFGIHNRKHGRNPDRIEGVGYRTASGIVVEMATFSISPSVREMKNFSKADRAARRGGVERFLQERGLTARSSTEKKASALSEAISVKGSRPFSRFLERLRRRLERGDKQLRSVLVTIPLASVATYHLGDLEAFARDMGIRGSGVLARLKETYLREFPEDLGNVAHNLADEVLVAHTTGVGGMYDEDSEGDRRIRLGFAHSALGQRLRTKQLFAEKLTRLYSERGIRMLVTAAAIGIDAIISKKVLGIQREVRGKLEKACRRSHRIVSETDLRSRTLRIYAPAVIDFYSPSNRKLRFRKGAPLMAEHVLRSGENGYFTVPNADALYRVMRVASASELGFLLARTAVFGDDPQSPRFRDNICNYTETDNSRQVFDLLDQPSLRSNQLSGLQPKALQDLGSAKHQSELHTLGLLILLHRLRTLDLSKIEHRVNLRFFDPQAYFEAHSKPLTFEDVSGWDVDNLANDLGQLVAARSETDLLSFFRQFQQPYPERQEAALRILQAVLRAVWSIPSLGTPILFEHEGRPRVCSGYYIAPLHRVISHEYGIIKAMRSELKDQLQRQNNGQGEESEHFRHLSEFYIANGFADLRPQATLVTALRPDQDDLADNIRVFKNEADYLEALSQRTPYSYFTSSGLVALLLRLKGLAKRARELNLSLGTANDYRAHFSYDEAGRALVVPGVVEAFRMVSEGLEKSTGSERLDGPWGY